MVFQTSLFPTCLSNLLLGLYLKIFALHSLGLISHDQVSGCRVKCSNPQAVSSEPWRGCSSSRSTAHCSPGQLQNAGSHLHHPFCSPEHWLPPLSCSKQGKSGCTICFAFPHQQHSLGQLCPKVRCCPLGPTAQGWKLPKTGRNNCPFLLFFAGMMFGKSSFWQEFGFQAVLKQSSFQLSKKAILPELDFTHCSEQSWVLCWWNALMCCAFSHSVPGYSPSRILGRV